MSAPVVVTVEREEPQHGGCLRVAVSLRSMRLTTEEAAALVAVLLADGEIHALWLHGKKP